VKAPPSRRARPHPRLSRRARAAGHSESRKCCPSPDARGRASTSPLVRRGNQERSGILRFALNDTRTRNVVQNPESRAEFHPHPLLRRGLSRNQAGEANSHWRGTRHPNSARCKRTLTFDPLPYGRGEDTPPAGRSISSCQPLSSRYAIIFIVLLSPTLTNTLTAQLSILTKMRSPNSTSSVAKRRALPYSFLRAPWTSDEEMQVMPDVNENFPIVHISTSERRLFHVARTVSLSHQIGRTVFMLNANVTYNSRES
jgi:hypothetical protein